MFQRAELLQKILDSMKSLYSRLKTREQASQLLSEQGTSSIYMGSIKIQYFNIVKPLSVLTGPAVLCFLCAGYLFGVAEAETSGKLLAGLKANR
jgi:hypothetical protein